jgi:hypothetical protein
LALDRASLLPLLVRLLLGTRVAAGAAAVTFALDDSLVAGPAGTGSLDGLPGRTAVWIRLEDRLGRAAAGHRVGHLIRLALVRVAGLPDVTLELNATLLLDDVRRLMRGEPDVRRLLEGDLTAPSVGAGAKLLIRPPRGAVHVRLDPGKVVLSEGRLNPPQPRQRPARPAQAA